MKYVNWALARLKEPSTWAAGGIGAIAVHTFAPGALGDATLGLFAAFGVFLGAVLPEQSA